MQRSQNILQLGSAYIPSRWLLHSTHAGQLRTNLQLLITIIANSEIIVNNPQSHKIVAIGEDVPIAFGVQTGKVLKLLEPLSERTYVSIERFYSKSTVDVATKTENKFGEDELTVEKTVAGEGITA